MAKNWEYIEDAKTCMHGTMICTACNMPITNGQYRVRETEDAYLPQHRRCSETDKEWAIIDAKNNRRLSEMRLRLAAYKEFRDKWGACELDDDIEQMERFINRSEIA